MIRSTVKVFQRFPEITEKVEQACREGLDAAAQEAASVAQAGASIDLELEVQPAHGDVDGYSAGIKSRKTSSGTRGGQSNATPIALFFDQGTLGKRTKPLKRPRKQSWPVKGRSGGSHTAERGDVEGKGIEPQRFFPKARAAGRVKLRERLSELDL